MQKREIQGIEHYNEMWFRSCFYHQRMAALSRYGVPFEYTILNYEEKINVQTNSPLYLMKARPILSEQEEQGLFGVRTICEERDDLIDYLIEKIDRGQPVMVAQDHFCLPYRRNYYLQKHGAHYVLIYGYDKRAKMFTAGESNFINGYDYGKKRIPMAVVEKAYQSFRLVLKKEKGGALYRFVKGRRRSLSQRLRLLKKMEQNFRERDYTVYARLYDLLLQKPLSTEELLLFESPVISLTAYFRILLEQLKLLFDRKAVNQTIEYVWRQAGIVKGLLVKAVLKGAPEIFFTENTQKFAAQIKLGLQTLNERIGS